MYVLTATFDIDKVDVVSSGVDHSPESHRIGDLTVEPDILVGGEKPSHMRADDTDNVSKHGHENEHAIEAQDETSSTGGPHGELEGVEPGQFSIRFLCNQAKQVSDAYLLLIERKSRAVESGGREIVYGRATT
jgi:hypothetical protein